MAAYIYKKLVLSKIGLDQAEYMYICYSTVQLPGASPAWAEVLLTHLVKFGTDKQTDSGVCRVFSATKKLVKFICKRASSLVLQI
jgi:hypothetical protein